MPSIFSFSIMVSNNVLLNISYYIICIKVTHVCIVATLVNFVPCWMMFSSNLNNLIIYPVSGLKKQLIVFHFTEDTLSPSLTKADTYINHNAHQVQTFWSEIQVCCDSSSKFRNCWPRAEVKSRPQRSGKITPLYLPTDLFHFQTSSLQPQSMLILRHLFGATKGFI